MELDDLHDECSARIVFNMCFLDELRRPGPWHPEARRWIRDRVQRNDELIKSIHLELELLEEDNRETLT